MIHGETFVSPLLGLERFLFLVVSHFENHLMKEISLNCIVEYWGANSHEKFSKKWKQKNFNGCCKF